MLGDPLVRHTARPIIASIATVLGFDDERSFLAELIVFGSRENRDCEPGAEAILKYLKTDRALSNSFALLLLEYIDARPVEMQNRVPAGLLEVLRERIQETDAIRARHAFPPPHDASERLLAEAPGVYVIIRPDTGQRSLVQDMLILESHGKGLDEGLAIFAGTFSVARGRWCAIRDVINVSLSGNRAHKRSEILSAAIAFDIGAAIYAGALLGTSTDLSLPAFAPALFIKISDEHVGDFPKLAAAATDSRLAFALAAVKTQMPEDDHATRVARGLLHRSITGPTASPADGTIIGPNSGMMAAYRDSGIEAQSLILPELAHLIAS